MPICDKYITYKINSYIKNKLKLNDNNKNTVLIKQAELYSIFPYAKVILECSCDYCNKTFSIKSCNLLRSQGKIKSQHNYIDDLTLCRACRTKKLAN